MSDNTEIKQAEVETQEVENASPKPTAPVKVKTETVVVEKDIDANKLKNRMSKAIKTFTDFSAKHKGVIDAGYITAKSEETGIPEEVFTRIVKDHRSTDVQKQKLVETVLSRAADRNAAESAINALDKQSREYFDYLTSSAEIDKAFNLLGVESSKQKEENSPEPTPTNPNTGTQTVTTQTEQELSVKVGNTVIDEKFIKQLTSNLSHKSQKSGLDVEVSLNTVTDILDNTTPEQRVVIMDMVDKLVNEKLGIETPPKSYQQVFSDGSVRRSLLNLT